MLKISFWSISCIPTKIKNHTLNFVYYIFFQKKINIDWRNIKIINSGKMSIGANFSSGQGLWLHTISKNSILEIGDNVNISDWSHIGALDKVTISSGCLIGSKVHITDHSHGSSGELKKAFDIPPNKRNLYSKGNVFIGKNVWIGDGVIVLPGVSIGDGSIIGANSVVTKDIPAFSVAIGVPAKVLVK